MSKAVSVAEGKKGFSHLIQDVISKRKETVITKRGTPVAVIVPYEEYQQSKRKEGYRKIMQARSVFLKAGIRADEVFRESRKQLEKRH